MSFKVINGREIEILDEPDFFEPKPVSPKTAGRRNSCQPLFVDMSGNIHIKIEEVKKRKHIIHRKRDHDFELVSILGKRKIDDVFGSGTNDSERYGQEISPDFFEKNVGHNVFCPSINYPINTPTNTPANTPTKVSACDEAEILEWCAKYLASKKH